MHRAYDLCLDHVELAVDDRGCRQAALGGAHRLHAAGAVVRAAEGYLLHAAVVDDVEHLADEDDAVGAGKVRVVGDREGVALERDLADTLGVCARGDEQLRGRGEAADDVAVVRRDDDTVEAELAHRRGHLRVADEFAGAAIARVDAIVDAIDDRLERVGDIGDAVGVEGDVVADAATRQVEVPEQGAAVDVEQVDAADRSADVGDADPQPAPLLVDLGPG